ncbi:MAG: hypothetical protein RO257_13480 [Candidatus Kapabacteria bacterium]|nr:hypothetical protein [Candidatus Kapabacteria bacterium]
MIKVKDINQCDSEFAYSVYIVTHDNIFTFKTEKAIFINMYLIKSTGK